MTEIVLKASHLETNTFPIRRIISYSFDTKFITKQFQANKRVNSKMNKKVI